MRAPRSATSSSVTNIDWTDLVVIDTEWEVIRRRLSFSARELQIVRLVFRDQTKERIGHDLGLSANTVSSYLVRLYRRLNVGGRHGLLVLCLSILKQRRTR